MMKMGKMTGLALSGFMAATTVQAQPVPHLYGRPGIPDDNQKINCVREAMFYFAGGDQGMIQSVFQEDGTTTYQFETKTQQDRIIGQVKVTGPRTMIDVFPETSVHAVTPSQASQQKTIYDYILQCDGRIMPVPS